MWDNFRSLFSELEDKTKKTDTIHLSKISETLANRRGFSLSIPGTHDVDRPAPQLAQIDPVFSVLPTQQHPRCIFMVDTSGVRYKFLLKGNEDIRLDERIMQFFDLINSLLLANRSTCNLNVSILKYAIIPFAPDAGLITWVTGADTFQQLVTDFRARRDVRQSVELEIAQALVGGTLNSLSALQRVEVYDAVTAETTGNELREMLWLRAPDAASWLLRNQNFTVSTALMSMAGYAIGLGDRHPSNIMVQRHTGRVIHIDFGDSFEVTMNRTVFAERVPFRMTRMIVNALDGSSVDGLFRRSCEDVLWVLRESQSSVIAQLEVFIHEPIFYGREMRSQVKPKAGILERVAAKLSGNDPARGGVVPVELDAAAQVATLIEIAADAREYVRHYVGWCPFW
jgi:phosphatidylinositol kinase/protein kinase (PI-3  family)